MAFAAPSAGRRLPDWFRKSLHAGRSAQETAGLLSELDLHTICESGRCPNRNECWSHGTASFMIMGDRCTRNCGYCAVSAGRPDPLDSEEPARLAEAVSRLKLRHVVITSVTRDDLADEGAGHFARTVRAVKEHNPDVIVEILTPDFRRDQAAAVAVLRELPVEIFNHNLETVRRLHRRARPQGGYDLSLALIEMLGAARPDRILKSGLMLGLGETEAEIVEAMRDLRARGCRMLTLGQYLKSFTEGLEVARWVAPSEFERLREIGYNIGFSLVESGPFVRSSYHAKDSFERLERILKNGDSQLHA